MVDFPHDRAIDAESEDAVEQGGFNRRRMVGYMIAGPTLMTAASVLNPSKAGAAGIPTVQVVDGYDLSDALRDSARPTHQNVALQVNEDGTVDFLLNRSENGQGITTAFAMIIAEEMDLPLEKVKVKLRDSDPSLMFNQLTGGSNSIFSLRQPVRTAAALAKAGLFSAASEQLGVPESALTATNGVISGGGQSVTYGSLAKAAAVSKTRRASVTLKPRSQFRIVGNRQVRTDARDAITGKKQFAMDLAIPDALPTMICRPPTHNGEAMKLLNEAEILKMPGVTDVGIIKVDIQYVGGVAVRAKTFGQCIDAIRKMKVEWKDGPVAGQSDPSVTKRIKETLPPLLPTLPGTVEQQDFLFHFRPGDPLEPNCAVADIREDKGTVWAAAKNPIWGQEFSAELCGMETGQIVFHVVDGGGSFGRKLFNDPAFEAAIASQMFKKPVKLMWHRADMPRQGRSKPAAMCRTRIVHNGAEVLSTDQVHAGVPNDLSHGLGEASSSNVSGEPAGVYGFSQTVFTLTAVTPYNFGVANHLLNEVFTIADFNTSSVRNVYSPELRTAQELMVDKVAMAMKKDPFDFRQEFARDERMQEVLKKLREVSDWGRAMPKGTAQGVAIHREYKAFIGYVMEIDARPKTVNRKVPRGVAGPRVTRVTCVVDPGLAINPSGYEAMMMGGAMDGIAQCLTYSLHLKDGRFLEGSWDHAHYTRQWNSPTKFECHIINSGKGEPGGAGELGVAPSMAATACALWRATGTMPKEFPVNFGTLGYKPFPAIPPIPKPPSNGFARARRERRLARRNYK
jgi:isoquinoline 1-oxidoreductase beta subunit